MTLQTAAVSYRGHKSSLGRASEQQRMYSICCACTYLAKPTEDLGDVERGAAIDTKPQLQEGSCDVAEVTTWCLAAVYPKSRHPSLASGTTDCGVAPSLGKAPTSLADPCTACAISRTIHYFNKSGCELMDSYQYK